MRTAAFAVTFAVGGLVALAVWSSDGGTYAQIARDNGFAETTEFLYPPGAPDAWARRTDLATLLAWHERWSAYVLGRSEDPLRGAADVAFTQDEVRHMADVRSVFVAAQVLMYVSAAIAILLVGLALREGTRAAGVLTRNGGAWAGGVVLVVGIVAAVAFGPVFLAFHYVFFPQGNFLFPSTSNLIRLYPETYWYAVTLRVGGAFIASAAAVTVSGWLMSRSGIVTRR